MGLNFDKLNIASNYTKGRQLYPKGKKIWFKEIQKGTVGKGVKKVLDLGCGIGRFLPFLKEIYPKAKIFGAEPSVQMLNEAKKTYGNSYKLTVAVAEDLPFKDKTFDLVFMSMVYHTLRDKKQAIKEIYRILTTGGFVVLKQFTLETNKDNIFWKFFPGSLNLANVQGDSGNHIVETFCKNGFISKVQKSITYPIAKNYWDLWDRERQRGRSVYKMVSDEIFYRDVENFRKYCEKHGKEGPVMDKRGLFIFQKV